jgi:fermentation-respiration switch protein FrsA (DUF1100 family)
VHSAYNVHMMEWHILPLLAGIENPKELIVHVPVPGTRRRRALAFAAGITTSAAAVGTLSVAYYVVDHLTRPQPNNPMADFVFTPFELGLPWEDVTFPSANGAHEVRGWWLPRAGSRSVIIGCAGFRGSKSDLLGIGRQLWMSGHNMLLIDFYGHGSSRGAPITLGFREVHDFLGAVSFAAERAPVLAIGAIGYSMGAAVVIMGAARDQRVQALVADSPFATHRDVVVSNIQRVAHLPEEPFATVTDRMLQWRAGYRFRQVEPVSEVAAIAPRPLLLIHATGDLTIPYQESEVIFAAAGEPKELWLVEGGSHCGAYFVDKIAYIRRVREFFARGLASPMELWDEADALG